MVWPFSVLVLFGDLRQSLPGQVLRTAFDNGSAIWRLSGIGVVPDFFFRLQSTEVGCRSEARAEAFVNCERIKSLKREAIQRFQSSLCNVVNFKYRCADALTPFVGFVTWEVYKQISIVLMCSSSCGIPSQGLNFDRCRNRIGMARPLSLSSPWVACRQLCETC